MGLSSAEGREDIVTSLTLLEMQQDLCCPPPSCLAKNSPFVRRKRGLKSRSVKSGGADGVSSREWAVPGSCLRRTAVPGVPRDSPCQSVDQSLSLYWRSSLLSNLSGRNFFGSPLLRLGTHTGVLGLAGTIWVLVRRTGSQVPVPCLLDQNSPIAGAQHRACELRGWTPGGGSGRAGFLPCDLCLYYPGHSGHMPVTLR